MARLGPVETDRMTPDERLVHDMIAGGPHGSVRGPLALWLRRPELASHAQALGRYCRYETSLPPRLSELAILTTARCWTSRYEWQAHMPIALDCGLSSAVIDAIRRDQPPPFDCEAESAIHAFTVMLHRERRVDDRTYGRTLAAVGEAGLIDLVGLLGYCALVSMTINVFHIETPGAEQVGDPG